MGRRAAVERIELIDPRDATGFAAPSAFAPSASPSAPATPPSPLSPSPSSSPRTGRAGRWTRIAAPLALVAIIAGVAIAVNVTDDDSTGAPSPTSTPSAATTISRTPTPPSTALPESNRDSRLIGTPPDGLAATVAFENSSGLTDYPGMPTSGALWADGIDASPGARVVEVAAATERSYHSGLGTVRLGTPFGPAVASIHHGQVTVVGPTSGGWATVQTTGLTLGEATHVLETVRIDDDRIVTGGVAVPAGLHLVGRTAGTTPLWQSYTLTQASSAAGDRASHERWLSVEVGPQMTAYQQTVEWFFLSSSRTVDVGGEQATLGTSTDSDSQKLTFDRDGLHVVIDAAGIEEQELVAYARGLHVADDATWHALLDSPPIEVTSPPDFTLAPCARGTLPGPVSWSAKCGIDVVAATHLEVELDLSTPNGPLFATNTALETSAPSIAAAATDRLSYVTAAVPAGVTGAVVRVLVGSTVVGTSSFATLQHTDTQVAVVAFTDLEPFTAQIVARDGNVLASYDPLATANPQELSTP